MGRPPTYQSDEARRAARKLAQRRYYVKNAVTLRARSIHYYRTKTGKPIDPDREEEQSAFQGEQDRQPARKAAQRRYYVKNAATLRARSTHYYRSKTGKPIDPNREEQQPTFQGLLDNWPTAGGLREVIAHARQAVDVWMGNKSLEKFGENVYQMRFASESDEQTRESWRMHVNALSTQAQALLTRCESLVDASFERDPSGRRGLHSMAADVRREVTRAGWVVDEMLSLEGEDVEQLREAYRNWDLDFQRRSGSSDIA